MNLKRVFILSFVIFSLDFCCGGRIKRDTLYIENVCSSTYYNFKKPSSTSQIFVDECLTIGKELKSLNGNFRLIMQEDGNLVLYQTGVPIWKTHSHKSNADRFCIQENQWALCKGPQTVLLFWQQIGKNAFFALQNDGNFVAYSSSGIALWSTDTFR